jgi:N6-L-threonylcarbamoyladenine synthase
LLVLGIESSCDETAASVVDETGRVLSDVVQSQFATHVPHGGIVPELASRDHVKNASFVVQEALSQAGVSCADLHGIAVTNRPGLVGALLVGVQFAKGLSYGAAKPIVGVDHLIGHLLSVFLQRGTEAALVPAYPFVSLLASGGHTAIYRVDGAAKAQITELGATRDDAAGEAFDKVAKLLGLGYPGGPIIDKLAQQGNALAFAFKVPMPSAESAEFSFSGLKTQIAVHIDKHGPPRTDQGMADFCASFQAQVTRVLARKLIAAALREKVQAVAIGGGVAANSELRARVAKGAAIAGLSCFLPEFRNCTDNAAMIAYAGATAFARGEQDDLRLTVQSKTALPRVTRKGRGDR